MKLVVILRRLYVGRLWSLEPTQAVSGGIDKTIVVGLEVLELQFVQKQIGQLNCLIQSLLGSLVLSHFVKILKLVVIIQALYLYFSITRVY
jgi:hypothetical protein